MAGIQTIGAEGIITSWAGTNNGTILTALGEHSASLDMTNDAADRTQYASGLKAMSSGPGLRSWGGTISGRLLTSSVPQVGYVGNLAVSSATDTYVTHVRSWSATITAIELDVTEYNSAATTAGWRSFRPGLVRLTGTFEALVDDATVLKPPYMATTTLPTLTLTLTTGNTLAFSAIVSQMGLAIPVGDLNRVTYSFESTGDITAAGTGNLFPAATIDIPTWDATPDGVADTTLVFQAAASRTFTGAAFWTSIGITHNPAAYIDVAVQYRGSGALTIG